MRRVVLLLLCILFYSLSTSAQQGVNTVAVHITEEGTQRSLAQLEVRIEGKFLGNTDERGTIIIDASLLPASIEISGAGIEKETLKIDRGSSVIELTVSRITNSLGETVVTGVAIPTRLKNALSLYKVIGQAENTAQGNITLADALSTQLNINVSNDGVLGTNMKIQGLAGNKLKILIDGLPVNGRENGNIDLGQLNLNNISRVEIVQGPMSVVYGSDALGGVINLITKHYTQPWTATGDFNYESVGRYNTNMMLARSWKHHQLSLGGGRNYFQGWNDQDTFSDKPHRRLLWKPKEQYLANIAYMYIRSDSGFKAQLASDFVKEKVTNKGQAEVNAVEGYAFDEYYRTTRSNNRLILEGKIGKKGHWESKNGYAYYHRIKERTKKDLVSLNEILTTATGDQDTSIFNDINLRSNYSNSRGHLKYDAGYDVNLEYANSGKIPNGTRNIGDYAIYEQFSYGLLRDKLTLQAGLRQTYNTQYKAPFIYSFQALYAMRDNIQLRASYAKGFRAPTLKEQYLEFIDQNHHVVGNPNLKAERGDHIQASASWQAYDYGANYLQFILTGFYNNVYDEIALAQVHPDIPFNNDYMYTNFTRDRNAIANFQAEQQWRNLHLVLEYSFRHTYAQLGSYDAYNLQEVSARVQYYWRWSGLSMSAFYKLNGASPNISLDIDGKATYKGELPAYNMLDASVERKFWEKRIQLVAGVKNIFNVQQLGMAAGSSGGAHSSDNSVNFLPRRFFTTLRLNLN